MITDVICSNFDEYTYVYTLHFLSCPYCLLCDVTFLTWSISVSNPSLGAVTFWHAWCGLGTCGNNKISFHMCSRAVIIYVVVQPLRSKCTWMCLPDYKVWLSLYLSCLVCFHLSPSNIPFSYKKNPTYPKLEHLQMWWKPPWSFYQIRKKAPQNAGI